MTAVDRVPIPAAVGLAAGGAMTAFFLQQLINGLTLGAVYGLIAIGYTMVYGIIGMINFAHGEVYMVSAYLCAIGLALLSFFGIHSFPLLIFATVRYAGSSGAHFKLAAGNCEKIVINC